MNYSEIVEYARNLYEYRFPFTAPGNQLVFNEEDWKKFLKDNWIPYSETAVSLRVSTMYGDIDIIREVKISNMDVHVCNVE